MYSRDKINYALPKNKKDDGTSVREQAQEAGRRMLYSRSTLPPEQLDLSPGRVYCDIPIEASLDSTPPNG